MASNTCCPGETKCGGQCVNLKNAKQHCGECGLACAGTARCKQGLCVAGGNYRFVRKWSADGLELPLGITVDRAGALYVTDDDPSFSLERRIWKFSGNGKLLTSWPAIGVRSTDIAITPGGTLYVAINTTRPLIQTYTDDGEPGFFFDIESQSLLWGLAIGPNTIVYVTSPDSNMVQRFSATGEQLTHWRGSAFGFRWPQWVAVAPNGDVYVSEVDAGQISRWSAGGVFKGRWGSPGTGNGEFGKPNAIAVDTRGFVYVADPLNRRIQKFTASGGFVGIIGGTSELTDPAGIAVSRTGMVSVTDYGDGTIVQFAPA